MMFLQKKSGEWHLGTVLGLMLGVYLFSTVVGFIKARYNASIGAKMVKEMREKLFHHIQTMSIEYFDNRKVGNITGRIMYDVNAAQRLMDNGIILLIIEISLGIAMIFILLFMNWKLALFSFAVLPCYYFIFVNTNARMRKAFRSYHKQSRVLSGILTTPAQQATGVLYSKLLLIVHEVPSLKGRKNRFGKNNTSYYSVHSLRPELGTDQEY